MSDSEKSNDNLDRAAELQDALNRKGIEAARKALASETDPNFDGKHCIDCDNDMPGLRLAMGRIRCTRCQELKERKLKGY